MSQYTLPVKKTRWLLWLIVGLVVAGGVVGVFVATVAIMTITSPPPPAKIVMATGQPGGAYDDFGKKYQQRLGAMGLHVDLVNTNGSVDNLKRLVNHEVDVAFVQGGTSALIDEDRRDDLRGLAAIYLEPLWVFSTAEAKSLAEFKGKRISIGPKGSGTEAVSRVLLKAHGIDPDDPSLIKNLTSADARKQLLAGDVDVALFVSSYKDKALLEFMKKPDVHLLNFRRDIAYAREFPYLTPVKLAEGVLDLQDNVPSEDKVLLAPSAMLVARKDIHPQVVDQVLKAATVIHREGSKIDPPNKYPSLEGMDLPVDEAADTYMKSGESTLSKLLPYWALRLVVYLKVLLVLLLPSVAVLVPVMKGLPAVYAWYYNRKLHRQYAALREVEIRILQAQTPEDVRGWLGALDAMKEEMEAVARKVPLKFQKDFYNWRLHVAVARDEGLARLRQMGAGEQAAATPAAR